MTGIIEFLLGHRVHEWSRWDFSFQAPVGTGTIIGVAFLLILTLWVLYRKTTTGVAPGVRRLLFFLKSAALIVLFLCLLQPSLTTSSVVPEESYIGVLIDNSKSMTIRDMAGSLSRGENVTDLLYGDDGLIDHLGKHFKLRIFGFDRDTKHMSDQAELSFSGLRTFTAKSMEHAADVMKGLHLSALVVVSDGGDNGLGDPVDMAHILKARKIPVYIIGVGGKEERRDVQITRVSSSGSVMEGAIFDVNVTVSSRGGKEGESELLIEEGDRVVASKKITYDEGDGVRRYTLKLTPEKEGPRLYRARIPEEKNEIIKENNFLPFLINNRKKRVEILYIEGHPRNEYKFIRRAAESDEALRLVSYLKTGPHKFLRQGIDSPMELSSGYPTTKEALVKYEAIIFGDISRDFFSDEQLTLTREFVSKRGGGFLMLGGSTAFDEEFIGSPIEDILPVTLVPEKEFPPMLGGGGRKGDHPTGRKYTLRLTPEGERSGLLRLGVEDDVNRQLWSKMPQLQGINVTGRAKPGARVLAIHPTLEYKGTSLPVIVHERYGRGRTMAITTATTWRWQMLMPHEDTSHEKFWRQILRWLARSAPPPVDITLEHGQYNVGDEVRVRARVSDNFYEPVTNATVWLKVTDPKDGVQDLRMERIIDDEGGYLGTFRVKQPGAYHLDVLSSQDSGKTGEASTSFFVAGSQIEFRNAVLNEALLQRTALASGGKYYDMENANGIVKDLKDLQKIRTVDISLDVWDMPIVFFSLLAFFSLEWVIRRRRGLS